MKRRLIKLGIIFSVTFNVAVVCAVAYGFFAKPASGNKVDFVTGYERVGLTDQERQVIRERYAETSRMLGEVRKRLTLRWAEMSALIAKPEPDWAAIRAKQEEILELHRENQTIILQRWEGAKRYLGPEKGPLFFEAVSDRLKRAAHRTEAEKSH